MKFMYCPTCASEKNFKKIDFGNTKIDRCPTCRGLWFENDELRKAKDEKVGWAKWYDVDLWSTKEKFNLKQSERTCPACRALFYKVGYGESGVEMEACKMCGGVWLEVGKFQKIIAHVKEKAGEAATRAYGRNLIAEMEEVLTGNESLISELGDVAVIARLFEYKFAAEHPSLSAILLGLPFGK